MSDLGPAPAQQDGIAARRQLLAAGVTPGRIRACLRSGRWQAVHPGVYATFSGPIPPRAMVWAAVLRAGRGAVAGPRTSLWLAGVLDAPPGRLDVLVPADRQLCGRPPFLVVRARGLAERTHPAARPPRLRVEDAVLDRCDALTTAEAVADLVIAAVQRRCTTAARLRARLAERTRHRWRAFLAEVLEEITHGVRSALERRWLRNVERAHGLPPSRSNARDAQAPRPVYRDFEYEEFGLVVETDGRETHPPEGAFRDRLRDNRVTVSGRRTLRYGWHEITHAPCAVAAEVASVLHLLGWTGMPHPCGPACPLATDRGGSVSLDDSGSPR